MTRDEGDVYKANEAFYSAFESLDIKEMEKVWLEEKYVQCIHPGWRSLTGWEDVMNSWRQIFENANEMRFLLSQLPLIVTNLKEALSLNHQVDFVRALMSVDSL